MSDRSSTSGDGTGVPEVDSLSGAYVLNALSDEERTLFEARMSESDDIRTEVADLNETALLLGHAVTPVTPSPALRASIMDLIGSTPQLAPLAEAQDPAPATSPVTGRHASDPFAPTGGEVLAPIPLARQRWFMRPGVLLAGAAAAAALIFGGVAIGHNGVVDHTPSTSQAQGDVSQILWATSRTSPPGAPRPCTGRASSSGRRSSSTA